MIHKRIWIICNKPPWTYLFAIFYGFICLIGFHEQIYPLLLCLPLIWLHIDRGWEWRQQVIKGRRLMELADQINIAEIRRFQEKQTMERFTKEYNEKLLRNK
jgi:hypothetical protein